MAQVLAGLGWDSCLPRRWPPSRSNRPKRHHLQPHQIQACPDGQKGSCGRHHCLDHGRGSRYLNPRLPGGKLKFRPGLEPTLNETGRELHMCWIASTLSCWKGPVFSAAQVFSGSIHRHARRCEQNLRRCCMQNPLRAQPAQQRLQSKAHRSDELLLMRSSQICPTTCSWLLLGFSLLRPCLRVLGACRLSFHGLNMRPGQTLSQEKELCIESGR